MPIIILKNVLTLACFCAVFWMSGCADLASQKPVPPLTLTFAEQARLGEAAATKLIQMLGGPYHDKSLAADLKRICLETSKAADSCKITVADRSPSALYPLPAGQIIVTRGLPTDISSNAELASLLEKGVVLAGHAYDNSATQGMNEAVGDLLSGTVSQYDPDAADIRLASLFEKTACKKDCLRSILDSGAGNAGTSELPASVKRLAELQPGYELLTMARAFEKQGDEAQAIATYLQAAAVTPDEPRILRALGMAYLRAGQLQSARLHLQKAVKLQPDYYRSRMGLGYLYLQTGKLHLANQSLAESVGLLPVTENLFLLAEAREQSGDLKAALSLYKVIVDSDPDSKLGRSSASRLEQSAGGQ
jgi:tetratricopeptide (TPR) repeat protein